jgi:hypothetical protein
LFENKAQEAKKLRISIGGQHSHQTK